MNRIRYCKEDSTFCRSFQEGVAIRDAYCARCGPPFRFMSANWRKLRIRGLSRCGDQAMTNSTNAFFAFSGQKARSRVRNCCSFKGRSAMPSPACTISTTLDHTEDMLAIRGEKPASEHNSIALSKTAEEVARDESTKFSCARSR